MITQNMLLRRAVFIRISCARYMRSEDEVAESISFRTRCSSFLPSSSAFAQAAPVSHHRPRVEMLRKSSRPTCSSLLPRPTSSAKFARSHAHSGCERRSTEFAGPDEDDRRLLFFRSKIMSRRTRMRTWDWACGCCPSTARTSASPPCLFAASSIAFARSRVRMTICLRAAGSSSRIRQPHCRRTSRRSSMSIPSSRPRNRRTKS
mmetsp:Transcript_10230/g.25100  ORF Transcript_10230/g.25100 Transcript_10230/m.25100 type:complete len:205 (-) Transcript_10230:139-753(-)